MVILVQTWLLEANTTISGHFLWAEMEGYTNRAGQSRPIQPISGKIAKMALFNQCMEFKIFLGQMTSFEVLRKCHFVILSKMCLRLRPCAYLGG